VSDTEAAAAAASAVDDNLLKAPVCNEQENESLVHFTFSPQTARQTKLDTMATSLANVARMRHDEIPETDEAKRA
jgi:hypothetical protein